MARRVCVAALALSFLVTLAMLPGAVNRLVDDVRALMAVEFNPAHIGAR